VGLLYLQTVGHKSVHLGSGLPLIALRHLVSLLASTPLVNCSWSGFPCKWRYINFETFNLFLNLNIWNLKSGWSFVAGGKVLLCGVVGHDHAMVSEEVWTRVQMYQRFCYGTCIVDRPGGIHYPVLGSQGKALDRLVMMTFYNYKAILLCGLQICHVCPRDSPNMTPEKNCQNGGVVRVTWTGKFLGVKC